MIPLKFIRKPRKEQEKLADSYIEKILAHTDQTFIHWAGNRNASCFLLS